MPTEFDDFSLKADRNYSDIDNEEAVNNVMILQNAMEKCGKKCRKNGNYHMEENTGGLYYSSKPL